MRRWLRDTYASDWGRMRFALALALGFWLLAFGAWVVHAQSSVPYNGDFQSGFDGWTRSYGATSSDCDFFAAAYYADPGSAYVYPTCELYSAPFHAVVGTLVAVDFHAYTTNGGLVRVYVRKQNGSSSYSDFTVCQMAWCDYTMSSVDAGNGSAWVTFTKVYSGTVVIDDVVVTNAVSDYVAGTSTPSGYFFQPGATPTPLNAATAAANVVLGTVTPYFSTAQITGVLHFPTPGGSAVVPNLAVMDLQSQSITFCLPDAVSQVFGDVSHCFSLPAIVATTFTFFGVDMLSWFSMMVTVVWILFLIRRIQKR